MPKKSFDYKAFISYTAHDGQFVNKLEEWLVHLSEHTDADQEYKFFRDSSYAEAGENVEEKLKQKLQESEWLILVCSPYVNDYKKSEKNWVDFECGYYAYSLGRKDNIVCIISDTAPLDRDISLFYPNSIQDLREKLAADMRGAKEWGKEASRIYAKITGRRFEDVYHIANTFYWENQYYSTTAAAYKKVWEGNNQEALQMMAEIPEKYNPGKIEWDYLKALCSKSAYNDYCGCLPQPAGNKVICFDKKFSYAYGTDNKCFYIINCLTAEVISAIEAHGGSMFRFFYMQEGYICTFDEQITVKLWKYDKETITLVNQASIKIQFSESEPAVFQSFYPDCQLANMPAACHYSTHQLALTVRHNLFVLNMETMEYKTMPIPSLKGTMSQLSCLWKNVVFSRNAEMVFLTDENYLLGWNLHNCNFVFLWNRKWCQPHQHTFYPKSNVFKVENTDCCIELHEHEKAEWKENDQTILYFDAIANKKLDSVYLASQSTDYMILLYEGSLVQVLKRNAGVVYLESISIQNLKTGLDSPEACCPAVLWRNELWHPVTHSIQRPLYDNNGNYLSGKRTSYNGLTVTASYEKSRISVYNEAGQFLREKEICTKKEPKMFSDEELNLPPGGVSDLLRMHLRKSMDQDIYECSAYDFADNETVIIGCTKGYLYMWEMESDLLTKIDSVHKNNITDVQAYRQWNVVLTADSAGTAAIWQYGREHDRNFFNLISSFCTQKTNIIAQLLSENRMAVFSNDTGELMLYDFSRKSQKMQILLSAEVAQQVHIFPVLSMYVTADLSRLVTCRKKQIDFIQLPTGKIVLESEMHGEMKDMKIYDDEKKIALTINGYPGCDYKQTLLIANLTEKEYDRLLSDRRRHFFSDRP